MPLKLATKTPDISLSGAAQVPLPVQLSDDTRFKLAHRSEQPDTSRLCGWDSALVMFLGTLWWKGKHHNAGVPLGR